MPACWCRLRAPTWMTLVTYGGCLCHQNIPGGLGEQRTYTSVRAGFRLGSQDSPTHFLRHAPFLPVGCGPCLFEKHKCGGNSRNLELGTLRLEVREPNAWPWKWSLEIPHVVGHRLPQQAPVLCGCGEASGPGQLALSGSLSQPPNAWSASSYK